MSKRQLQLTRGERIFLARRRNRESQEVAAACALVSRMQYQRAELDVDPRPVPSPRAIRPTPLEELVILRRRSGLTQDEVAHSLGLSRQWVNKMELGKIEATRLQEFWERRERGIEGRAARRG